VVLNRRPKFIVEILAVGRSPGLRIKGPLLFLVYINDLGENINMGIHLFADDATHSHASRNLILDQPLKQIED
jgi:hypothetical protein